MEKIVGGISVESDKPPGILTFRSANSHDHANIRPCCVCENGSSSTQKIAARYTVWRSSRPNRRVQRGNRNFLFSDRELPISDSISRIPIGISQFPIPALEIPSSCLRNTRGVDGGERRGREARARYGEEKFNRLTSTTPAASIEASPYRARPSVRHPSSAEEGS
jgi:hypothetical protein